MNPEYVKLYTDFLKQHLKLKKPLTIVADSSNGSAGMIINSLTNIPNLNIISINDIPNGDFPAHGPNPLLAGATDQAAKKVIESKADFGVIFDADADRAFFVDDKGTTLPSFLISILLFKAQKPPYIADETVFKSLEHMNLFKAEELIPSRVGSLFIKEKLKEKHASVGAEFSGHYYYKDFFGVDSGIFTMVTVLNILSGIDMKLSAYIASLPKQILQSVDIKLVNTTWKDVEPKVTAFAEKSGIKVETREGITLDAGNVWVNIRASNTEPLLRIIGGGNTAEDISSLISQIQALI